MSKERKFPITLRITKEDENRLHILNLIPNYPKHQVKSKFFALLIKDRCDYLLKELGKKKDRNETEEEVLKLLTEMEQGNDSTRS